MQLSGVACAEVAIAARPIIGIFLEAIFILAQTPATVSAPTVASFALSIFC